MSTTTTQTSTELQDQLRTLTTRRAQLATDADLSARELATARQGLIDGKVKADAVTACQSRHEALQGALQSLDDAISDKRRQLEEATATEARATKQEQLQRLQIDYDIASAALTSVHEDGNRIMDALVHRVKDAELAKGNARNAFNSLAAEIGQAELAPPRQRECLPPYGAAIMQAVAIVELEEWQRNQKRLSQRNAERQHRPLMSQAPAWMRPNEGRTEPQDRAAMPWEVSR